jgi:hypothetical protein
VVAPLAVSVTVPPEQYGAGVGTVTIGDGLIVIAFVAVLVQPLEVTVYTTVALPAVVPVTTPPDVIVADPVPLVMDQVPPAVASVKAGDAVFTHTEDAPPPIAATVGKAFIVTVAVLLHPLLSL